MEQEIKKYLEGRASREEILRLISWLDKKEENHVAFKQIKSNWKSDPDHQNVPFYTLLELDKFKSKLLRESSGKIKKLNFTQNFYRIASILLLVITIGSIYYAGKTGENPAFCNTIIAENGQISKALLPDGSEVWLNSGSSLKYSNRFGISNRNLELSGQAYFDVAENKSLPFKVACDEINIKVTGTKFTAEAYPDNVEMNVILVEGAVELISAGNKKAFASLQPNEMMVYHKQDRQFSVKKVVAQKYTSWREGIIHIYDQPLKDAVAKIQKRYNQPIILDKELEDYKVTFSIRNENFKEVMDVLLAITPASAYQKGEVIYLKRK